MRRYRYSSWDGTQDPFAMDADELMDAMADELMSHGDASRALRNLMRRGMQGRMGSGFEGLRRMLERLKQQSRERLERYNLASVIDELKKRLDEILHMERRALEAAGREAPQEGGEAGKAPDAATSSPLQATPAQPSSSPRSAADPWRQERLQFLDQLPPDFAGRVQALSDYEFFSPEAQQAFDALMEMLKQQALGTMFRDLAQRLASMTPQELQRLKEMLADLNHMLDQQIWGEEPDFEGFMQKYGDLFGPQPPQSLEELVQQLASRMAHMQALFNSLPEEVREELQQMLASALQDEELAAELAELQANLDFLASDERRAYEFTGQEAVPLEQALRLMDELHTIDRLQEQLAAAERRGSLEDIDAEALERILGPEGRQELEKLRELERLLEQAGYLRRKGDRLELTPKGIRKLGLKALQEIFNRIKMGRYGGHPTARRGPGVEATHETKRYEFGDHFHLDLQQSIMNAVRRQGKGVPVRVHPDDFEVYENDNLNQCSTVLMLDQSRSMGLNGCFDAAKKVALALHSLIKMQFPRDTLYVIGFAEYAHELRHEDIPTASWGSYYPGTNMHHALMLARRLLSRHRHGQRQILMITDGEPTAHLEQGLAYFNYPPSWRTIEQTLLEVKRCTKEGIVINTFMMEQDPYLMRFVQEITRINRGRAFFSSPHHLGEYIVMDYLNNKRRRRIA
ncbi:MAG: hypothetical protein KatS3mg131_2354 [Candidatus Tectimicrobiota bacterium]|nr:MAG: hypothetical protein KatS3mg131_2354 [Candidatus Tectomicrobia bacterium]